MIEVPGFDGRWGCGPTRVLPEIVNELAANQYHILGHSHRADEVESEIKGLRKAVGRLLKVPEDYEIVIGIGGATLFFDMVPLNLIEKCSQHVVHGKNGFSEKLAGIVADIPYLTEPEIERGHVDRRAGKPRRSDTVDAYVMTENETAAGLAMAIRRPEPSLDKLVIVDATSSAGATDIDIKQTDAYFFSLQKAFGSDGGTWMAVLSPQAVERAQQLTDFRRRHEIPVPATHDLSTAITASRKNQTLNTPNVSSIFIARRMAEIYLERGGLEWNSDRCTGMADRVYDFAASCDCASPYPLRVGDRSITTPVILLDDSISAKAIAETMTERGVYDIVGYRSLGANTLRIGTFPQNEPEHLEIVLENLGEVIETSVGK